MTSSNKNEALAEQCLAHLAAETAVVDQKLSIANQVRHSLSARDTDALAVIPAQVESHQRQQATVRKQRQQLQQAIASSLRLPRDQSSIGAVAEHASPSTRQRLRHQASQLRQKVLEVHQINQRNLTMAVHFGDLLNALLQTLTGEADVRRYGSSGRIDVASGPTLFRADC